ncbi:unnamed protein product [Angiostrongylus costaricensis]|uniref:Anoctamin n=1 Tax=Angiostrongylus costaricensis TaxID=334426 RepID=A0A0R3PYI5_ANGCS|nr:unnamed protein product [Angiostrongylus costaricensis]
MLRVQPVYDTVDVSTHGSVANALIPFAKIGIVSFRHFFDSIHESHPFSPALSLNGFRPPPSPSDTELIAAECDCDQSRWTRAPSDSSPPPPPAAASPDPPPVDPTTLQYRILWRDRARRRCGGAGDQYRQLSGCPRLDFMYSFISQTGALPSTNGLQTSDSENQADDNVWAFFGRSIRAIVTISMQLIIMSVVVVLNIGYASDLRWWSHVFTAEVQRLADERTPQRPLPSRHPSIAQAFLKEMWSVEKRSERETCEGERNNAQVQWIESETPHKHIDFCPLLGFYQSSLLRTFLNRTATDERKFEEESNHENLSV